jgi:hypothetical protein
MRRTHDASLQHRTPHRRPDAALAPRRLMPPDDERARTTRVEVLVALVGCIALSFAVYGSALGNAFFNDDSAFLADGRELAVHPSRILELRPLNYCRPVWLAWVAVLESLFGATPLPFFIAGIVLHGINGAVLYGVARLLRMPRAAAATSAFLFVIFFSHSEATLWMASHNSSLCAGLSMAALALHLNAVVCLALFTKETAIAVFAWIPIGEVCLRGFRALFSREALLRYALLAFALLLFLLLNDRFRDAMRGASAGPESMADFHNISPARILGSLPILFSPLGTRPGDVFPWTGALWLVACLGVCAAAGRDVLRNATTAFAIAFAAAVPVCTTVFQHHASSRLYYFPTAGAALAAGALAEAALRRRSTTILFAVALAAYAVVSASSVWRLNEHYYKPFSRLQTKAAWTAGRHLPPGENATVHLVEPPIDNIMHLRNFLLLDFNVPWEWVELSYCSAPRFGEWARAETARGARVLAFTGERWEPVDAVPKPLKPLLRQALGLEVPPAEAPSELSIYTIQWKSQ